MADDAVLDTLKANHPAVGDLPELLERLRLLDRLTIGTERAQHAAALLERLARSGVRLENPELAAQWLGPILCVTTRDRQILAERLARDAARRMPMAPTTPRVLATVSALQIRRRRVIERWIWPVVIVVLLAMILIALYATPRRDPDQSPTPTPTPTTAREFIRLEDWQRALQFFGGGLAAAAIGVVIFRRRRDEEAILERSPMPSGQGLAWFDEGVLQAPLRIMGRQRRDRGRQLDLVATIHRTIARAGWPAVVRGGPPRTPEHVVFVELDHDDDTRALPAATLIDRLVQADLRVTAYACDPGFTIFRRWGRGESVALARIAALHRGARLLVVSEGAALHDPFAERLTEPASFADFAVKILVTPRARASWSWREFAFDRAGWRIAELSTEGVADLARWLSGPREALPMLAEPASADPGFAVLLARDARLFRDDDGLPLELRRKLLDRLVSHLDPDPEKPAATFDVLRVLAIGSQLAPHAIENVASHLASLEGPRADEDGLRRLFALPWFARGRMPNWLREDLLRDMPPALAAQAREAWLLHLARQPIRKGTLTPEQREQLAEESRLVLLDPTRGDMTMRRALGLEERRSWWPDFREMTIIAATTVIAATLPLFARLDFWAALSLAPIGAFIFEPIVLLFGEMMQVAGVLAVLASFLAVTPWARIPIWLRFSAGAVALFFAMMRLWWNYDSQYQDREAIATITTALSAIAIVSLRQSSRPLLNIRSVFLPGHPWVNLGAISALVFLIVVLADSPFQAIGREVGIGLAAAAFAALLGWRVHVLIDGGIGVVMRAAAAFVAGQALAGGAWIALSGLFLISRGTGENEFVLYPAELLVRLAFGFIATVDCLGIAERRVSRRLEIALLFGAGCTLVMFILGSGREEKLALLAAYGVPWSLVVAWIAVPAIDMRRRIVPGLIYGGITVAISLAAVSDLATDRTARVPVLFIHHMFIWPMLRAMRPDLASRSDGLWWRCLLLLPLAITFEIPEFRGVTLGNLQILALPVAAWIAARHGMRALPALGLTFAWLVLPTLYRIPPSDIGIPFGTALAAMLLARFVADRAFREACFAAESLTPLQLAILALLPISWVAPEIETATLRIDGFMLTIVILALIGISRVRLFIPFAVLGTAALFAFVLQIAGLLPLRHAGGTYGYTMNAMPRDLITIMLALGAFRVLRDGAMPAWSARIFSAILSAPTALLAAALMSLFVIALNLRLAIGPGVTPLGSGPNITPFARTQLLLLAFFWGAAGLAWSTMRLRWRDREFAVPWVAWTYFAVAAITFALPSLRWVFGPLVVALSVTDLHRIAAEFIVICVMFRLGELSRGLLGIVPTVDLMTGFARVAVARTQLAK